MLGEIYRGPWDIVLFVFLILLFPDELFCALRVVFMLVIN